MLLCWECKPSIIEEDTKENKSDKRGFGKAERDDEEEWKRIPIPTSDDSSEGDWATEEFWLEESPRSEGENEEDVAAPIIAEERIETYARNKIFCVEMMRLGDKY